MKGYSRRRKQKHGGEASFIHTDVAREADAKAAVDFTVKTDGRLAAALLNASSEIAGPLDQVTEETDQNAFNSNVWDVHRGK